MPNNNKKDTRGGKQFRNNNFNRNSRRAEIVEKEGEQEYAEVEKLLGDCRVVLKCFDGMQRVGHIRGKMFRRVWINVGDVVLVGLRDFEGGKADIIHKYNVDESRELMSRYMSKRGSSNPYDSDNIDMNIGDDEQDIEFI